MRGEVRHLIYGIFTKDGKCVYVGRTRKSLKERLCNHLHSRGSSKMKFHRWLKSTQVEVEIVLLEDTGTLDYGYRQQSRENFWIKKMLSEGHPLQNVHGVHPAHNSFKRRDGGLDGQDL